MKKFVSIVLTFAFVLGIICIPVTANAAVKNFNLELGKTYTNTVDKPVTMYGIVMESHSHVYTFTMNKSSNIGIAVASEGESQNWQLKSTDYSVRFATQSTPSSVSCYLPKNKTYTLTVSGAGKYALKVTELAPDKITSKGNTLKLTAKKTVSFNFSGTTDYAKNNLSVSSSKPKVATASVSVSGNKGILNIDPHYIGKTTITVKMGGSNSIKYTVHGVQGYWFVAKGSKAKAPKPVGVKKPKWKSSKKKIAKINKKTGKIKAKKGGRVTFTAKKGKISYKIKTVVTDYIKLGKKAYKKIKSEVNNPDKLKVYNVYKGYSKQIDRNYKIPVVVIDFGSTNSNGAMIRSKVMAYYDDVYEMHIANGWSIDNIIGRKSIKPSKIKK